MSRGPGAGMWAGAFALSLLAHAGLGSALLMVPAGEQVTAVQTRFELRSAERGETAPVVGRALEAVEIREVAALAEPVLAAPRPSTRQEVSAAQADVAPRVTQSIDADRPEVPSVGPVATTEVAGSAEQRVDAAAPVVSSLARPVNPASEGVRTTGAEAILAPSAAPGERAEASVGAPERVASRVREQVAAVPAPARQEVPAIASSPPGRQKPMVAATRSEARNVQGQAAHAPVASPQPVVQRAAAVGSSGVSERERPRMYAPPLETAAKAAPAVTTRQEGAVERADAAIASPAAVAAARDATPAPRSPAVSIAPGASDGAVLAALIPDEPRLPEPREITRSDVMAALAAEPGGECFLALAGSVGGPTEVKGFGADPARLGAFEQRLSSAFGGAVHLRSHAIAAPQCATIAFARDAAREPEAEITISLDQFVILSGTELTGRLSGVDRPWLHLFVIDDEGVVHELDQLQHAGEGSIAFSAPLTLTDGRVGTEQLLFALAADEPLLTPALGKGALADAFFAELTSELGSRGIEIDFGLAAFRVE